jgi:hypothetical protein
MMPRLISDQMAAGGRSLVRDRRCMSALNAHSKNRTHTFKNSQAKSKCLNFPIAWPADAPHRIDKCVKAVGGFHGRYNTPLKVFSDFNEPAVEQIAYNNRIMLNGCDLRGRFGKVWNPQLSGNLSDKCWRISYEQTTGAR